MRLGIAQLGVILAACVAFASNADAAPIDFDVSATGPFVASDAQNSYGTADLLTDDNDAEMFEVDAFVSSLIVNDPGFPGFPDPPIALLVPVAGAKVLFELDFTTADPGTPDEFFVFLLDPASGNPFGTASTEFLSMGSFSGTVTLDLGSLVGMVPAGDSVGLQFEINDFDFAQDSIAIIDNLRVEISAAPPVPEPGTLALFGVAAAGAYILRRRRNA